MGIQARVEERLERFTTIPGELRPWVARQVATVLGRLGESQKFDITAVAKKDGIYFGSKETTKVADFPAGRIFAAACQLAAAVDKVENPKGQYRVKTEACIEVSDALIQTWTAEMAEHESAKTKSKVETTPA